MASFDCISMMSSHTSSINTVRFTSDGSYCMTGSDDRTIKLWNPHKIDSTTTESSGKNLMDKEALLVKAYDGPHGYPVLCLTIAVDKSKFASAGRDRAAFLWDVSSGRTIRRIQAHLQPTNAICFNTDATVLLTASNDRTVCCWDLRAPNNREPIQRLTDFEDSVTSLSRTDSTIIAGCVDGKVRIYDLRGGYLHTDDMNLPITSIEVSEDQQTYLCACVGGPLVLSDLQNGSRLQEYVGHKHEAYKVEAVFNKSDNTHILCGGEDGTVVHWDMKSGMVNSSMTHSHSKNISSISFHPTLPVYLTASNDGSAKCWAAKVK